MAPLEFKVDDGKAVGLLLAELARRDSLSGFDRAAVQGEKREKEKMRRKRERVKVRAGGDLALSGL